MDPATATRPRNSGGFRLAALLLGFGFAGFFDGVLLHQILQWHHLLSAWRDGPFADLRVQVLADGLFHTAMFVLALAGLGLLVRARGELGAAGAPSRLLAGFATGFAAWHVVDAVAVHWVFGLHRIRMEATVPLAWDIGWLVVFGLVPLVLAAALRRSAVPVRATPAAMAIAGLTIAAGLWSARGPAGDGMVVVLRPDAPAGPLLVALAGTEARIVGSDRQGGVWLLASAAGLPHAPLYRAGALWVSGGAWPAGCAAWLVAAPAR